jgi:hypothetical protein
VPGTYQCDHESVPGTYQCGHAYVPGTYQCGYEHMPGTDYSGANSFSIAATMRGSVGSTADVNPAFR